MIFQKLEVSTFLCSPVLSGTSPQSLKASTATAPPTSPACSTSMVDSTLTLLWYNLEISCLLSIQVYQSMQTSCQWRLLPSARRTAQEVSEHTLSIPQIEFVSFSELPSCCRRSCPHICHLSCCFRISSLAISSSWIDWNRWHLTSVQNFIDFDIRSCRSRRQHGGKVNVSGTSLLQS